MEKNLKYSIINSLLLTGTFKFNKEYFFKQYLSKIYDQSASYNFSPIIEIEKYFQNLELSDFNLKDIEILSWSSYEDIVYDIWGQYDGEDDYFNIKSLEGIDICPNIKEIHIEYVWSVSDISPLSKLNKLEEITIFSGKIEVDSLMPLISLPKLKKVNIEGLYPKDKSEIEKVVSELKSKGIKADIS